MSVFTIRRQQEVELPAVVDVTFINPVSDYQQGLQQGRRISTLSVQRITMQLPIVLSDANAKKIADRLLFNAWQERNSFSFKISRRYSYLEPTDVIQVREAVSKVIYTMRITKKVESRNGEIEIEAVAESYSLYIQKAVTGSAPDVGQVIPPTSDTNLTFLDIPALRESEDTTGYHISGAGMATGWPGGALYKSVDGGTTFDLFVSMGAEGAYGETTNALADWFGGMTFDEGSTVNVELGPYVATTLSSQSRLAVLNGGNIAALQSGTGWEIIQFREAILQMDGSYTLSGLLRGRYGTEWATEGHAVGDKFVLLTAGSTTFVPMPSGETGLLRYYKGVTVGQLIADVDAVAFTNTSVNLKCYSPCHLGGGRNASNDLTLKWVRRTRINGDWIDYADAPLKEASELYDVEIWNSAYSTLKRTFSSLTSPTVEYTAAQQVTDFGSTQSTVYFKVFQISAARGRGYEKKGTI